MTFHQIWLRLYIFNLVMIPVSIVLYFIQDKEAHLFGTLLWSVCAFLGLAIHEGLLCNDHHHSK